MCLMGDGMLPRVFCFRAGYKTGWGDGEQRKGLWVSYLVFLTLILFLLIFWLNLILEYTYDEFIAHKPI